MHFHPLFSVLRVSLSSVFVFTTDDDNCIVVEMFGFHLFKIWLVKFGDSYIMLVPSHTGFFAVYYKVPAIFTSEFKMLYYANCTIHLKIYAM